MNRLLAFREKFFDTFREELFSIKGALFKGSWRVAPEGLLIRFIRVASVAEKSIQFNK